MSERSYNSSFNPAEAFNQDAEPGTEKAKKEKEAAEKKRKKQKKQTATERDKDNFIAEKKSEQGKPDTKKASVFDELLGIDKGDSRSAQKKRLEEQSGGAKSKDTSETIAQTTDTRAEQTKSEPERLDDAETIEAAQAYIAARSAQLQVEANQNTASDTDNEGRPAEMGQQQAHANLGFLQALKRSLLREKTAPNEGMLEASLQEATESQAGDENDSVEQIDIDEVPPGTDAAEEVSSVEPKPPSITSHPASGELQSDGVVHLSAIEPESATLEYPEDTAPAEFGGSQLGGSPVSSAAESASAMPSKSTIERSQPRTGAGEFLLGGFVGYLLGKRRGRIKTERELEPVRASLEGQVTKLEQTIRTYEERARASVRQQRDTPVSVASRSEQANSADDTYEKPQQTTPDKSNTSPEETAQKPEASSASENYGQTAESIKRTAMEQSESLARTQQATAEQISHLGITRETIDQKSGLIEAEASDSKDSRMDMLTPERVDTTGTAALLYRAESIRYNNQSLRTLYEQGKVSDRVLRVALKEHLRGNNIDMYLDKELEKAQTAPEIYSPETASNNHSAKRFDDGPALDTRPNNFSAPELPAVSRGSNQPGEYRETQKHNSQIEQSQSQKMKQATLGAVFGLIIVIILWYFYVAAV